MQQLNILKILYIFKNKFVQAFFKKKKLKLFFCVSGGLERKTPSRNFKFYGGAMVLV